MVLTFGFGGLLILLALAEVDGIRALQLVQSTSAAMEDDFLARTRILDRVRSDLYLSGTYVRDYLLDREASHAEAHRASLLQSRGDMDAALADYEKLAMGEEAAPFQDLRGQLADYWRVSEPVLSWTPEARQRDGYAFLRDEVFPRRMAMLRIAGGISKMAESQLSRGRARAEASFQRFKDRQVLTVALTTLLGVLLAVFSVRRILGLEKEAAERLEETSNARSELRHLSARLVAAQEEERRSLSRELHDEVGQALSAVLLELANLSTLARTGEGEALQAKTGEIRGLVEETVRVVRNLALLLRPSMLDDLGLVPALQWQAKEVSKRTGMWVKVAAEHVSDDLPEQLKTCVYRVVQEALHNCARHSGGHSVRVSICQEDDRILVSVQDDGRGFPSPHERGLGMLGMAERVDRLGGSFSASSEAGGGAVVRIVLPTELNP